MPRIAPRTSHFPCADDGHMQFLLKVASDAPHKHPCETQMSQNFSSSPRAQRVHCETKRDPKSSGKSSKTNAHKIA